MERHPHHSLIPRDASDCLVFVCDRIRKRRRRLNRLRCRCPRLISSLRLRGRRPPRRKQTQTRMLMPRRGLLRRQTMAQSKEAKGKE